MSRLDEFVKIEEERGYFTEDEWYEITLLKYGAPRHAVVPDKHYAQGYSGRLPDVLLRLWLEQGWGSWNRGKFWLCDPALLQPVIDTVFLGDPEYDSDTMTVFAYDAFGKIYIWLGDRRILRIDWVGNYAIVQQYDGWNPYANVPESESINLIGAIQVAIYTSSNGIDGATHLGPDGKDMLPAAIARLGELGRDEVYGFFPAIGIGGANDINNLQRVPILEHLMFLASIQTPILRRFEPPADDQPGIGRLIDIRPLGPLNRSP